MKSRMGFRSLLFLACFTPFYVSAALCQDNTVPQWQARDASFRALNEAREEIQRAIAMTTNLREQELLANRLKQLEKAVFSL